MNTVCEIKYNIQITALRFCKYRLLIDNKKIYLNFPQILQLRQRINCFTTPEKLSEIIDNENFVLLFIADRKHLLYLEIPQLFDLKQELDFFFYRF